MFQSSQTALTFRYYLIFFLLFIIIPSTTLCESTPPQTTPGSLTSRQPPPLTQQPSLESQPTNQPNASAELVDTDLSTPKKSTASFVKLFNDIMPVTPETTLQTICTEFTTKSAKNNCLQILEDRLRYLKSLQNLKGAMFTRQAPTQISKSPMRVRASWQEQLSFFDGPTKTNHETMTLTLQQSGKQWKIIKLQWEHPNFDPKLLPPPEINSVVDN